MKVLSSKYKGLLVHIVYHGQRTNVYVMCNKTTQAAIRIQ